MPADVVTGGAGFIGSHLVEALTALGRKVRVLDNFSTGTLANLARAMRHIDLITGDVADYSVVREAMEGAEAVFHMAPPVVGEGGDRGTLNVLRSAHAAGVRRVVVASSWRVHHFVPGIEASPYVAAKAAAEKSCAEFTRDFGLETVCLRFGNVYGPRQPEESPEWEGILPILRAMVSHQRPAIRGTGKKPQYLIYVEDAVHAALLAADVPRVPGRVYDIGGRSTTMLDILGICNAIAGLHMEPVFETNGTGATPSIQADFSRAEIDLGFCPSVSLEQGLRHSIAHFASHREEILTAQVSANDLDPREPSRG